MIHLFVIADDFTGALDTGVQFASYGAATKVVVGTGLQALEADAQTQVLVVDAETRHLPAAQAYDTVYRLVRWAKEKKIGCIYKKTDSALRGNIGAELSAALAADGGDRLHFVPAFPNLDRVTRGGVHYIGGVPVAQSVFGKDPFEPVTHSRVEDILHEQTDTLCAYIPGGGSAEGKAGVLVYEAQTNRDMAQIADRLAARSETGLLAGCAGFASVLPRLLQLSCRDT
ncbi:four-carbon acid sugar kinase family protein, partial [Ruthenibacterium lactatiformans]